MPYPAQVDQTTIVEQAHAMIEAEGVDALSLHKLATALGVKAPSLYRHLRNKAELVQAVNFLTLRRLMAALQEVSTNVPASPTVQLLEIAKAFRRFAYESPHTYVLAFTSADRGNEDQLVALVLPLQQIIAKISGQAESLTALRGLLALVHGFVMLELHQQLRRGGDLEAAFERVIQVYLAGWQDDRMRG